MRNVARQSYNRLASDAVIDRFLIPVFGLTDYFFCQVIFKHCLQWKRVESAKPTDPYKERNILNLCLSVTAVALRKYVYTCFPGLVYNECQVTLPFLQIYPSMSVPNNSYCKRLLLSRW